MAKRKVAKKKADSSVKRYSCPKCKEGFNPPDLKDKKCPHCNTRLKAERHRKTDGSKGFYYQYVIEDMAGDVINHQIPIAPKDPPPAPEKPAEIQGVLITRKGEVPEVWRTDEGEVDEEGNRLKAKYTAIYENVIHAGWVFCPQCNKPMYQNQIINSGGGHAENHICRNNDCKANVTFIFKANMRMGFRGAW